MQTAIPADLERLLAAVVEPAADAESCRVGDPTVSTGAPAVRLLDLLPSHLRPAPLATFAEEEYRGRGIVGFRMPPLMLPGDAASCKTQREFRAALLPAIRAWLTEELPRQAKAAMLHWHAPLLERATPTLCGWDVPGSSSDAEINRGAWPGARLYQLADETQKAGIQWPWVPADYYDRFNACAMWAADVCEKFLTGSDFVYAPAAAALDFLRVDRLEDGRTLLDLWNWPSQQGCEVLTPHGEGGSRFGPLRDAPPLPEDESESESESETEAQGEEAAEDDTDWGGELTLYMKKSDEGDVWLRVSGTLTIPLWVVGAVGGLLLSYLWVVGFLVGRR